MSQESINLSKPGELDYLSGLDYLYGNNGVTQSGTGAEECFLEAVNIGYHVKAMYCLAFHYETGEHGFTKDLGEAFKYYYDAATADFPEAQYRLAEAYEKGELNLKISANVAKGWYESAASSGHPGAQYRLGNCYEKGELNTAIDLGKALAFYLKAANAEYPAAQYYLGMCYKEGGKCGVLKNLKVAEHWFREAAKKGYPGADAMIATVSLEQKPQFAYLNGSGNSNSHSASSSTLISSFASDKKDIIVGKAEKLPLDIVNPVPEDKTSLAEKKSQNELNDKDEKKMVQVTERFSLKPNDINQLIKNTNHSDWTVRWQAVHDLGRGLGKNLADDLRPLEVVMKAAQDPEMAVRREAVHVLGWMRQAMAQFKSIRMVVINALQDPEEDVRRTALYGLEHLAPELARHPDVREAMLKFVGDQDYKIRQVVVQVLASMGPALANDPDILKAVMNAADDKEVFVRQEAIYTLGQLGQELGNEKHLPVLKRVINALNDENQTVKRAAIYALGRLGPGLLRQSGGLEEVIKTLNNPKEDIPIRLEAIRALKQLGPELAASPFAEQALIAITKAIDDPEEVFEIQDEAFDVLYYQLREKLSDHKEAVDALFKVAENSKEDFQFRRKALETLMQIKSFAHYSALQEKIQALQMIIDDEDEGVQRGSREVLGLLRKGLNPEAQGAFEQISNPEEDDKPPMRPASPSFSLTQENKLTGNVDDSIAQAIQILGNIDANPYDKMDAINKLGKVFEALGKVGVKEADYSSEGPLAAVMGATTHRDKDVREKAISALGKLGPELARQPKILDVLVKAAQDSDSGYVALNIMVQLNVKILDDYPALLNAIESRDKRLGLGVWSPAIIKALGEIGVKLTYYPTALQMVMYAKEAYNSSVAAKVLRRLGEKLAKYSDKSKEVQAVVKLYGILGNAATCVLEARVVKQGLPEVKKARVKHTSEHPDKTSPEKAEKLTLDEEQNPPDIIILPTKKQIQRNRSEFKENRIKRDFDKDMKDLREGFTKPETQIAMLLDHIAFYKGQVKEISPLLTEEDFPDSSESAYKVQRNRYLDYLYEECERLFNNFNKTLNVENGQYVHSRFKGMEKREIIQIESLLTTQYLDKPSSGTVPFNSGLTTKTEVEPLSCETVRQEEDPTSQGLYKSSEPMDPLNDGRRTSTEIKPPVSPKSSSSFQLVNNQLSSNLLGEAEYVKGLNYLYGNNGVTKNGQTAEHWFLVAAISYHAKAMYYLALHYETGEHGFTKNLENALKFYQDAAKGKDPEAQYRLAKAYEKGQLNLVSNAEFAKSLYLSAASLGHPGAQSRLDSNGELKPATAESSASSSILASSSTWFPSRPESKKKLHKESPKVNPATTPISKSDEANVASPTD